MDRGEIKGVYRADTLHPMVGVPMPRYDLVKKNRYVNRTFVQTSRGCHQGCTFCAEPLMNGLKFRYRPIDEVIHEVENCGQRTISLNDADFFGTEEQAQGGDEGAQGARHPLAGRLSRASSPRRTRCWSSRPRAAATC